jgi:glycosyltransferase involved in cell wall biosynthesis
LALAIFWTQFGLDEARAGGYTGPAVVIPLGVDLGVYYPMDKHDARLRRGLPKMLDDAFIVGNVNRNQPRKRWDLSIKYFAEWVHNGPLKDAYLFFHTAPTGDMGIQVTQLAIRYGVIQRLILVQPSTFYGLSEQSMRETYNCFDVQISTTQGEGFGLTTFEGMACGVPQIVPDWSALGELCKDAARLVPCTSTAIGPPYVNVIGGVADERAFVRELDSLYKNRALREQTALDGLARAAEDRFRWAHIGEQVRAAAEQVVQRSDAANQERQARNAEAYEETERVAFGLGGATEAVLA